MVFLPETFLGIGAAGGISGVGGGMMERGVEGLLYYGGAPGTEEPDWTPTSFVANAGGGVAGQYAGKIAGKYTEELFEITLIEETVDKLTELSIEWISDFEYNYYRPEDYYINEYPRLNVGGGGGGGTLSMSTTVCY